MPDRPRTDPGVRHDRTGLFDVMRLRTLLHLKSLPVWSALACISSRYRSGARWLRHAWSCHGGLLPHVLASLPGLPVLWTPAMPPCVQQPLDVGEALGKA